MWLFFGSALVAGVHKSLWSYFSSTTAPLSPVRETTPVLRIRSRVIPGPPKASKRRVGLPRKTPTPTISSNSGCENQDGPTLAEVQDGPTLAEVQDGPAPVALFHLKLMI